MLVVTRYVVPAPQAQEFLALARVALAVLTACPGCAAGRLGRNVDDPCLWVLATTWDGAGSYRRALSSFEVKVHAVPLLSRAIDEPSAYEDLLTATGPGTVQEHEPSRAADADVVDPGRWPEPDGAPEPGSVAR